MKTAGSEIRASEPAKFGESAPMYSARRQADRQPAAVNPFEINRRVLASDLSLAAKAVLLVILDHARHGLSKCTASTRTLAREARITDRHVRNVLPELEARRLI